MDEIYIKIKGHRFTNNVPLINSTILLTLCYPNIVMKKPLLPFFMQAIDGDGLPHKVVMDKSGANHTGLKNINLLLLVAGWLSFIEIIQVK